MAQSAYNKNELEEKQMAVKYNEIWNSIVDCELELLENDTIKEKIMLEQIVKVAQEKLNKYK